MIKRIITYSVLVFLQVIATAFAENNSFENQDFFNAIKASIPLQWKITEVTENKLPYGHYWGTHYSGRKGQMIIIEGPSDVTCCLRDNAGKWNKLPVAKETLEIWIMPPGYKDSWKRFFFPHRPIPAIHIFESKAGTVYGKTAHNVIDRTAFSALLDKSTSISWPESPVNTGEVSWRSWKEDLKRGLGALQK